MDQQLQKIWERKLQKALAAERDSDLQAQVELVLTQSRKAPIEWRIYDVVYNWGFSERLVAQKLRISQQAVSKVLVKFLNSRPSLRPTPADHKIKSSEVLPSGFHRPGKTRLKGCNSP